MKALPLVEVPVELGVLTRWLRIAGFPTCTRPQNAGVQLDPASASHHYQVLVHPENRPVRSVLVSGSDWRPQLAAIAADLGVTFPDLTPHRFCPGCGGELDAVPPEVVRKTAPRRLRPTGPGFACQGCRKVRASSSSAVHHLRTLRDVFLEFLFVCARCGVEGGRTGRNLLRLELLASVGPVEVPPEDLTRDPSAEIARLLRQIERMSESELTDSVAFHRERTLCDPCRGAFVSLVQGFLRMDPP